MKRSFYLRPRAVAVLLMLAGAANGAAEDKTEMSVEKTAFGKTEGGEAAALFTCTNENGLVLKMTDYGATVVAMIVPDKSGNMENVTLGFDSVEGYEKHGAFFGATVGRYANRIAKGRFELDGKTYELATNNGENHLHGGNKGFNRAIWKAAPLEEKDRVGVTFRHRSEDGDEGYPGNLDVKVTYALTNSNDLVIEYAAKTDKPTVLNLTNHCYWNLAGAGAGDILKQRVMIAADSYLAVDNGLIPTGERTPVKGTPLDFTAPKAIGARIASLKEEPAGPKGYDHCFVLRGEEGEMKLAARVTDPESGRVMVIRTTQPGIQFYTGNFLDGDAANGGHEQHAAFCLETQHFPDSPNQPEFPSTVLQSGEEFRSRTTHSFTVKND